MQAVILAGGLGTRLRSLLEDRPKPMALVRGRPFLEHLVSRLSRSGFSEVILCLGYMADKIIAHFEARSWDISIRFSIEEEPLGTGGAVKKALNLLNDIFVLLNGDTWIELDYEKIMNFHLDHRPVLTMALRNLGYVDSRFGSVTIDASGRILSFSTKASTDLINVGVYCVNKHEIAWDSLPTSFGLETDLIPKLVSSGETYGFITEGYFRDLGYPQDLLEFEKEAPI